jgi:hypothetical protein
MQPGRCAPNFSMLIKRRLVLFRNLISPGGTHQGTI